MLSFVQSYRSSHLPAIMEDCLLRNHLSGDGPYCRKSESLLQQYTESTKTLLTTSCTHALEMCAVLLDLRPGDEVIMPSFTFVSTANAFVLRGAVPVFVDIREDTLNLDERLIEAAITERTRAIVVVHYGGVACEMDSILELAQRHDLVVIEDNAHGLFGRYKGRALGSFGKLSTLSFHETKNISCGEGGALCLNDPAWVERAEILREKGTNRSRFFRGQVDKYTWVDVGSSWVLSEILGAVLYSQLLIGEEIQQMRKEIWHRYQQVFAAIEHDTGACLTPRIPEHCECPWHVYYIRLKDTDTRTRLIQHLRKNEIAAVFHYIPLHSSPCGRRYAETLQLPVTERVSETLLRLPLFPALSLTQQEKVIACAQEFLLQEG